MADFATRDELNGLGTRLNEISGIVSEHKADLRNTKDQLEGLWKAAEHSRNEDGRIENMVHNIAKDVAKQNVYFLIANAVIVGLIVKFLGAQ